MSHLLLDLKHTLRALVKAPGFTLAVIFTLALGIGANASIFSLLDQVLWQPLPFRDPGSLVIPHEIVVEESQSVRQFSAPNFLDLQRETHSFVSLAGFMSRELNLAGDGRPEVVRAGRVSTNFFDVLGASPCLGRTFLSNEGVEGAQHVAVLGYEFWQRRFGGDPSVLQRVIRLDGEAWQVVGVMRKDFQFPYRLGRADLYFPIAFNARELASDARGNHYFSGVARLKPGVSLEAASQDMAHVMAGLAKAYPDSCAGESAGVKPLKSMTLGRKLNEQIKRRNQLLLLMGVAGLVLLIACLNVANLLLARGLSRRQELAIRASLGAGRAQLLRQLMCESLVLALVGGALGLIASTWISAGLLRVVNLPTGITPDLSVRAFAVMGGVTLFTSLLFGALPAWQATRGDLVPALREGSKGSASAATHRLRSALVVGQMALATTLLVSTGLMLRSLWHMQSLPLGYEPRQLITGNLHIPESAIATPAKTEAFTRALSARLNASPGVAAAALTNTMPMGGSSNDSGYDVEGEPDLPPGHTQASFVHLVTPGFFHTLQISILKGRDFTWDERPNTIIVSESLARKHFQNQDPIGRRLRIGDDQWLEIVGLVASAEQNKPGEALLPHIYRPLADRPTPWLQAVARSKTEAIDLQGLLSAVSVELDPDLPMTRIRTMESLVKDSMDAERAQGILMATFAIVALVLALVGIYGLMSFIARGRTRELGIRSALGATMRDLLTLILGQGSRLIALGLGLGIMVAIMLGRALSSQLQDVSSLDLGTYLSVTAVLGLTALLACLMPALRAARVDPAIALRSE